MSRSEEMKRLVKKYEKVFQYITEHLSMNLRLKEIAEQTNYSIGFDTAANNEVEGKLMDAVIAGLEAEIPEVMYTNRIDEMVRDFEYRMSAQGINLDMYLQYTGMDMESFRGNFREQAERQVKTRLALEGIVKAEGIDLTEEELEAEYNKAAETYNITADELKKYVPADDMKADATVSKAIQFVRDNAVITVVDSIEEEKTEEPASEE